jgi:hypothetical protein
MKKQGMDIETNQDFSQVYKVGNEGKLSRINGYIDSSNGDKYDLLIDFKRKARDKGDVTLWMVEINWDDTDTGGMFLAKCSHLITIKNSPRIIACESQDRLKPSCTLVFVDGEIIWTLYGSAYRVPIEEDDEFEGFEYIKEHFTRGFWLWKTVHTFYVPIIRTKKYIVSYMEVPRLKRLPVRMFDESKSVDANFREHKEYVSTIPWLPLTYDMQTQGR